MAYASSTCVAAFTPNLTGGASDFSASTTPTQAQVNAWLSSGCAMIETRLSQEGYAVPVAATAAVYQEIADLNAFYAVARAEFARTNVRLAPGERTRGQQFQQMFTDGLKALMQQDLSRAGVSYAHAGYVGGVSQSNKDTVNADGDRVQDRFRSDQFRNPGATGPLSQTRTI